MCLWHKAKEACLWKVLYACYNKAYFCVSKTAALHHEIIPTNISHPLCFSCYNKSAVTALLRYYSVNILNTDGCDAAKFPCCKNKQPFCMFFPCPSWSHLCYLSSLSLYLLSDKTLHIQPELLFTGSFWSTWSIPGLSWMEHEGRFNGQYHTSCFWQQMRKCPTAAIIACSNPPILQPHRSSITLQETNLTLITTLEFVQYFL